MHCFLTLPQFNWWTVLSVKYQLQRKTFLYRNKSTVDKCNNYHIWVGEKYLFSNSTKLCHKSIVWCSDVCVLIWVDFLLTDSIFPVGLLGADALHVYLVLSWFCASSMFIYGRVEIFIFYCNHKLTFFFQHQICFNKHKSS